MTRTEQEPEEEALELLRRSTLALEQWRDDYVLVGGWAMQLFRELDGMDADVEVQRTLDVDIAVDSSLGDELRERLMQTRLTAIPSRSTSPPITRFQRVERGDQELAPVHLEFLVPMRGKGSNGVENIGPGIGAQALRYLELSFQQRRLVELPRWRGFPSLHVQVPSPASYLMGKALTLKQRKPNKRDKDYAYIYLLARMSRRSWAELRADFEALDVVPKWRRRATLELRKAFAAASAPGVLGAVRSLDEPEVDEALVFGVMSRFSSALGLLE